MSASATIAGPDLAEGYRRCAELTRRHGTTYFWGAAILPKEQRRHVHAVYALCRLADDIVDAPGATDPDRVAATEQALREFQASFTRAVDEGADNAMALPCYADEGRDIDAVIDDELKKAGLSMDMDARQFLRRNLGGDRLASRGEIEKLFLYAHGHERITLEDVRATSGDVSGLSFDDAVDALLEGRTADFDTAFLRHCQAGNQAFLILSAAMRQFQAIHAMRGAMEADGRNAAAVVASHRPPVFFSRRKLVEKTLERWDSEAIGRALTRLQNAVLQTRRRSDLSEALARQALLGIALESNRIAQKRH